MKAKIPNRIRKRHNRMMPYGFFEDSEDPKYMNPDPKVLEVLEEVAEYITLKALSIRDAAKYITMKTEVPITHEGLRMLLIDKTHPIFTYE